MDQLPLLSHERLDVYQISIRFLALCQKIIASTARGYGDLIDQLRRAAVSVPLNIAEASGRTGAADNARHFAIARGSALESGAIMDALRALGILDEKTFLEAKRLLISVVSMLSKLCMKK